jgi:hypothetical protein
LCDSIRRREERVIRGIRNVLARGASIALVLLLAAPPAPRAQTGADSRPFKPEQLEQIVAPLALYPDPLLAQIMMASTYPLEVVQAARFAQANPNLKDAALNEELKKQTWDDSVKALVSFPEVLAMMDSQLEWMQKLGDAVLAQQKDVMDAIQRLRAKAQAAGNLTSTEQQNVIVESAPAPPTIIRIEPTNPEIIYVPTYNPTIVYGAWPYPAYPPYYYYPPYYPVGYFYASAAISFGFGMLVGGAIWGNCNWGGGDIDIDVNRQNNFTKNVNRGDRVNPLNADRGSGARDDRASWRHNPEHRKGTQYRDAATQQRFNRGADSTRAAARESFRGRAEQGRQDLSRGPGQGAARSREGGFGSAGGAQRPGGAGQGGAGAARGRDAIGSGAGGDRGGAGGGRAFEGVGQGPSQRAYSQRGQSSRGSSYGAGGSRGGGGGFSGGAGGRGGGGGGRGGGRR